MPLISIVVTLFVTLNPIGNIPVFIGLLREFDHKKQQKIIFREMLIVLFIMLLFGFMGEAVLNVLKINITVVRIAGGMILFLIALNMIFPKQHTTEAVQQEPLIVPLAIPIVAGPASISTMMVFANQEQNDLKMFIALICAWVPAVVILLLSSQLKRLCGERILYAFERLAGIVLIFIAVQMIAVGSIDYAKSLKLAFIL